MPHPPPSDPAQPPVPQLDDVAMLLVQLEPSDEPELEHVRQALTRIARAADDLDAAVALGAAATQLAAVLADPDGDGSVAALARANGLVEQAMARLAALAFAGVARGLAPRAARISGPTPSPEDEMAAALAADPAWADALLEEGDVPSGVAPPPAPPVAASPVAAPRAAPASSAPPSLEPDRLPGDADLDLLRDFVAEGRECLASAEAALLALEHDPGDAEAVNTVFRAFHTLKGTAAFMGLGRISEFAHHAESLLSRVRDRELAFAGPCADLSLRAADLLAGMLAGVEAALAGAPLALPAEYGALLAALVALESGAPAAAAPPAALATPVATPVATPMVPPPAASPAVPPSPTTPAGAAAAPGGAGGPDAARGGPPESQHAAAGAPERHRIAAAIGAASPAAGVGDAERRRGGDRRQGTDRRQGGESTVRVRTERLDQLIDMVGELVIAQSMIAQDADVLHAQRGPLGAKVTHAGKLVRDLQDLAMSMRMVPLRTTFQKLTRLVRDLAHVTGKQVELVAEGEDTEIDRNMVDVIGDPLVHMVRNALDHGLESPEERAAAGKPPTGTLRLHAYHAGGSVVVELRDDGRGMDRARILAKARERGIVGADRHLTDGEVLDLVFAPGFSTADRVTDISGRGVGMDVVKRNVESLRGRVEIASEAGQGTTFTMRLPLTLAITDGMLVRVGAERYVVPTAAIHMSFRPEPEMVSTVAGRGEVVLLRDELMPVVRVHRLLDVPDAVTEPARGILMIVGDGDRRVAVLVDELLGQHQLVVKSLGGAVGAVPGISGAAILGDGRVGLILDLAGVVSLARAGGEGRTAA